MKTDMIDVQAADGAASSRVAASVSIGQSAVVQAVSPGYFALVMATGILAVAAWLLGLAWVGRVLLGVASVCYVVLWVLMGRRLLRAPAGLAADLQDHERSPGFFTWIAGTCVLGLGYMHVVPLPWVATGLGVAAAVLWVVLCYAIFLALTVAGRKPRLSQGINGSWLLAVVATQAMSVTWLGLADLLVVDWLVVVALLFWLMGVVFYSWISSLIFYRYTFFAMAPRYMTPPYWINMGAAAISSLAGVWLLDRTGEPLFPAELRPFVLGMVLLFWVVATWWIPMLLLLGYWRHVRCRFPLTYDPMYWGAVFPLGIYTACNWNLARVLQWPVLGKVAWVFLTIGLVAWSVVFTGMIRTWWRRAVSQPVHASPM